MPLFPKREKKGNHAKCIDYRQGSWLSVWCAGLEIMLSPPAGFVRGVPAFNSFAALLQNHLVYLLSVGISLWNLFPLFNGVSGTSELSLLK